MYIPICNRVSAWFEIYINVSLTSAEIASLLLLLFFHAMPVRFYSARTCLCALQHYFFMHVKKSHLLLPKKKILTFFHTYGNFTNEWQQWSSFQFLRHIRVGNTKQISLLINKNYKLQESKLDSWECLKCRIYS